MPPQEQGKREPAIIIYPTYTVNKNIKAAENSRPYVRVDGKNKNNTRSISIIMIDNPIVWDQPAISGDLLSVRMKFS